MTATVEARTAATSRPVRGRRGTHPNALLALIAAGAAAVLALWWHDTPAITGLGDWLTNAGRVTGLLAGYSVVVLLALMARLPVLEHGVGADRLARWHATGGRYTVGLVAAHALLITWGYSVTAHTGLVHQTSVLLTSYPDVLMATVAGLLLVGVGIVSARAARRRLRYETWYYLHFYTYLAIALAFSHQFADGAEFMNSLAARVLWSTMYAAVAAALLWFRILTPTRQAFRHRLRVTSVRQESSDVVSVTLTGQHVDELAAQPGQFFRFRFLTRDLWWSANPYSLSAPVRGNSMRVTVQASGDHSGALHRLHPGVRVWAEGPYGAFTARLRRQEKVLLLAGGVGVTPLRALFQSLPGRVTLVYRASDPGKVLFRRELDKIAAARGASVHYLIGSRRELGYDPISPVVLARLVPELRDHDVYLCGPAGMANAAVRALRAAGVPKKHIHHESFEL